ncbi:MAG: pyruvate dehydrogenase [Magnetococcales bacterium]|nr:pyruvate dehydrogenase [Magnetococcales bacterium]
MFTDGQFIRTVEQSFLDLFSQGRLSGTVHTCVGQELSALAFAGQLEAGDFIFSNHRCHGHFLAFDNNIAKGHHRGLMAEIMGLGEGVCGGVSGSQHLCWNRFFSNGIQGGIVPVAAGHALAEKLSDKAHIGIVFIGDGTLGEGVVYETLNLIAKWSIPLLIVCENNRYAQSTPTESALAGDIVARAQAFGIESWSGSTEQPEALFASARQAIDHVRSQGQPAFHLVETYRLVPHSKGDDNRDPREIARFAERDPLTLWSREEPEAAGEAREAADRAVAQTLAGLEQAQPMTIADYFPIPPQPEPIQWRELVFDSDLKGKRLVKLLNRFLAEEMGRNQDLVLLGEDIRSPYGGAFKVTLGLSDQYPDRVFGSPISEAGLAGVANGLALAGKRPVLEIMFGDFIILALDQIINHASKFHHMYNRQVTCPVVIRTPMGGGRGYGPTHSQTLDKFLIGIDNVSVVALNRLFDPGEIYEGVMAQAHPVIVIENKRDYALPVLRERQDHWRYLRSGGDFPWARITPALSKPDVTVVTYGGMVAGVLELLEPLFLDHEQLLEVIVPSRIHPLDITPILQSVEETGALVVVEEGTLFAGLGAEIIARVAEEIQRPFRAKRIGALPAPIPAARSLEEEVLPSHDAILRTIGEWLT